MPLGEKLRNFKPPKKKSPLEEFFFGGYITNTHLTSLQSFHSLRSAGGIKSIRSSDKSASFKDRILTALKVGQF